MTAGGHVTRHLLRVLLKRAIEAAGETARPVGARVHEMRTALKKARALLRLVRPPLGHRARVAQRRLAAVAGRIGSVRDTGVVLDTFDHVAGPAGARSTELSALRVRLDARRRKVEQHARTAKDLRRAGVILRLEWRRAKKLLHHPIAPSALATAFARTYRKARAAMNEAYRRDTIEAFHAWRKTVKTHAFQVALLAEGGVTDLEERRDPLDALGTALGDAHDLALLEQTIRAERAGVADPRGHERLLALIEARWRRLVRNARPLGARLFAQRPGEVRRLVAGAGPWRRHMTGRGERL